MKSRNSSLAGAILLTGILALGYASAQDAPMKESVSFEAGTLIDGSTPVKGVLTLPAKRDEKLPAVVVIHSSGGFEDPTRAPYVAALNKAGIATLELNLFARGGRPKTSQMNLPHTYGALAYLANRPEIDPTRIGITGFSHGGLLSMFSASEELTQQYTGGKYKFGAHVPLYPVCWAHLATIEGKNPVYKQAIYQKLTGAPVHILAGEKDAYDDPDTCQKFVDALPDNARQQVGLTVYPDATHGWDSEYKNYHDGAANKGRGGWVTHQRNEAAAKQSLEFVTGFFSTKLAKN